MALIVAVSGGVDDGTVGCGSKLAMVGGVCDFLTDPFLSPRLNPTFSFSKTTPASSLRLTSPTSATLVRVAWLDLVGCAGSICAT